MKKRPMKDDALPAIFRIQTAFLSCLLMTAMGAAPARAAEVAYLAGGDNLWSASSNWSGGVVPAAPAAPASNSVLFNSLPSGVTTLRIDGGPGAYSINVINLNYNETDSLLIRNANQATNTVTFNVTGDLTKDGAGGLRFHTAAGGSIALRVAGDLIVNAGSVQVGSDFAVAQNLAIEGNTSITGGQLRMRLTNRGSAEAPIELGNVTVATGAGLSLWEGSNNSTHTQYFRLTGLKGGGAVYATNGALSNDTYSAHVEIDASTNDNVFSGTLSELQAGEVASSISLTKSGAGSLTLSGSNAYSGVTTVAGGTLVLSHTSALGTGEVSVAGGTFLTGVSNIDVGGDFSMSAGALDINGFAVGSISLGEAVSLTLTGGTVHLDILSGSSFDQILGDGGAFSISGVTFDLTGSTLAEGQYAVLAGFASGDVSNVSFIGATGWQVGLGNDGILEIQAVPEPKTVAFILAGLILALWKRPSRA